MASGVNSHLFTLSKPGTSETPSSRSQLQPETLQPMTTTVQIQPPQGVASRFTAPEGTGSSTVETDLLESDQDAQEGRAHEEPTALQSPFPIKPKTEQLYRASIKFMTNFSESRRREDQDETEVVPVTLRDLAEDLLGRKDLTPKTIKLYRAALLWHSRTLATSSPDAAVAREAADVVPMLEAVRQVVGRPREKDTPDSIPEADYHLLLAELGERAIAGSLWASRAQAWLMAGVLTGVRPGEWPSAAWANTEAGILEVVNGKAKLCEPAFIRAQMDRERAERQRLGLESSDRPTRQILIERAFDREAVDTHLQNLRSWLSTWPDQQEARPRGRPRKDDLASAKITPFEQLTEQQIEDGYAAYYNASRSTIRHACLRVWSGQKMYSLYSARGQFSANARAQHGPNKTSALMGHVAPDSPSAAHYAKRGAAHGRFKSLGAERIRADGAELAEGMREHLENRTTRVTLQASVDNT